MNGGRLLIPLAILASGCTHVPDLRAPDSFFAKNPVQEVVVISSGRVEWPGMAGKEAVLGFAESKKALETVTPAICSAFKAKAYEVVLCEPAGIAYYNPSYKENRVAEEGGGGKEWQLKDKEPAYLYPALQKDPQLSQALRNIHEKMELDLSKRQWGRFVPEKDDLQVVMKATGADTICLSRIHGRKFSAARKAAAVATTVLLAVTGVAGPMVNDRTELSVSCASLVTGEVLWQYAHNASVDPVVPGDALVPAALQYFPDKDKPLDAKYKREKRKTSEQDMAKQR